MYVNGGYAPGYRPCGCGTGCGCGKSAWSWTYPPPNISEEQVRKIVREELERAKKQGKFPDVTVRVDGDMLVAQLEILVGRLEKMISDAQGEVA
ncbi:MAG: hypothetical protein KIT08_01345 [Anaerolineales bacterium]|nr:MAG: hypothetical protein KIT08_01345 [Anaerolineales bacterium]